MRRIICVLAAWKPTNVLGLSGLPITWTRCILNRTGTRCLEANSRSARKNENNDFVFKCLVVRKKNNRTKNEPNEMPKNHGTRKECTWMADWRNTLQWPHCWPLRQKQKKIRRISTTLCAKYTLCSKKTQAASRTIHLAICSSNIYL